jgi:hypothetical protein
MAKQKGIIKLEGSIGDITFFKSKDGYLAREKSGITADRIANDPAFQRTRENGAEFGRAGKAGRILRTAFRSLLQNTTSNGMVGRLTREMMRVIQADVTSARGLRNVIDGEAELLNGFEFNEGGKLGSTFFAPFTATIDRVAGSLGLTVPSFIPINMIASPSGATHYKMIFAGAEIDFENESYVSNENNSGNLPLSNAASLVLNLSSTVTANSVHPLFIVFGIEFYQEVNGTMYSLKNGAFNALQVVKVEGV